MNATKNLLTNLCNLLVCACEAFRYGLTFLRAILCSRAVLAAKLLAVESQLAACKQRIDSNRRPRPRFTATFRFLWVVLSKSLDKWEDLAYLMQPATVKKWQNVRTTGISRIPTKPLSQDSNREVCFCNMRCSRRTWLRCAFPSPVTLRRTKCPETDTLHK
jgi:hypothetical protein